ncbi:restriction endonuclease subunit S, partial [Fructilactobacillus florum]|uniref:restriction endonuclease subunit S n=1 Tax=Fructilactobacillus florum TaxID=640331 RepID=UPI001782D487
PWEQRKLGDICKVQGGGTPSSQSSRYWDGDINWFTPTEVFNNGFLNRSKRRITSIGLKNSSAKLMPSGTVLMTSRAGVGDMAILSEPSATNQGFQSLIPNKGIFSYFLYSMHDEISKEANRLASGSTFTEISNKQVNKINVFIPIAANERKLIANFFKYYDFYIAANERKL